MEGWKSGRVEEWKGSHTVPPVRVFSRLPVKWQISERSEKEGQKRKGGQVKSWRLILNSVFCFLTSVLAVRIEFEFEGDQLLYRETPKEGQVKSRVPSLRRQNSEPGRRGLARCPRRSRWRCIELPMFLPTVDERNRKRGDSLQV